MSASLVISAASINAAGTTLTLTISGVSGNLSPASGITGITVHNDSTTQFALGTITTSGATVTVPLNAFCLSGAVPTVDLITASNLTDTAADTPVGQAGFAIANGSTQSATSFPYTDPHFYFIGDKTTNSYQGRTQIYIYCAEGDFFETVLVGSSAQALLLVISGTPSISIDGGAASTPTLQASRWSWVTLFSGLTDGPHVVRITGTGANINFDQMSTVQLQGIAPATLIPTGYGAYTTMAEAVSTNDITLDTFPLIYENGWIWQYPNADFSFVATVTDIWLYVNTSIACLTVVYQDGVQIAAVDLSGSPPTYTLLHLCAGLDGAQHNYRIVVPIVNSAAVEIACLGIMLTGAGFSGSPPPRKSANAFYGDSIVFGYGIELQSGATGDGRLTDAWLVSAPSGRNGYRPSQIGVNASTWGRDNTGLVTGNALFPEPVLVWIGLGYNDAANSVPLGAVGTPGTFIGDYYTMLVNMRTGLGAGVAVKAREILPTSGLTSTVRSNYNAGMSAAVSAYITNTGDVAVQLINTDNWINPAIDTVDGIHPTAAGYVKIASYEVPISGAAIVQVSGPRYGQVGTPSGNFTVSLANGLFSNGQTITISDGLGASGGTITPSVGAPGTGSVTVTPSSGAAGFTFTYEPPGKGTFTLSFTNNSSWANPASMLYTVQYLSGLATLGPASALGAGQGRNSATGIGTLGPMGARGTATGKNAFSGDGTFGPLGAVGMLRLPAIPSRIRSLPVDVRTRSLPVDN